MSYIFIRWYYKMYITTVFLFRHNLSSLPIILFYTYLLKKEWQGKCPPRKLHASIIGNVQTVLLTLGQVFRVNVCCQTFGPCRVGIESHKRREGSIYPCRCHMTKILKNRRHELFAMKIAYAAEEPSSMHTGRFSKTSSVSHNIPA